MTVREIVLPTPNSIPQSLAVSTDGHVWFTERGANMIGRIDPSGQLVEYAIPTASSGASSIALDHDGTVWFVERDANKIAKIDASGTIVEYPLPTVQAQPDNLRVGPDGSLWFTEEAANQIGRIDQFGTITEFPIPTLSSAPNSLQITPSGILWFTERNGNKVGRMALAEPGTIDEFPIPPTFTAGGYSSSPAFTSPIEHPYGLVVAGDGNLWLLANAAVDGPPESPIRIDVLLRLDPSGSFDVTNQGFWSAIPASAPDGTIWFATASGVLSHVAPSSGFRDIAIDPVQPQQVTLKMYDCNYCYPIAYLAIPVRIRNANPDSVGAAFSMYAVGYSSDCTVEIHNDAAARTDSPLGPGQAFFGKIALVFRGWNFRSRTEDGRVSPIRCHIHFHLYPGATESSYMVDLNYSNNRTDFVVDVNNPY